MRIQGEENNEWILIELGKRIKDIRISRSITQEELAHNAGLSFSTVVRLENGEGSNIENMMKILRVLNLIQNFDLLVPEQQQRPEDILKNKPKRRRASKPKKDAEWKWGDES